MSLEENLKIVRKAVSAAVSNAKRDSDDVRLLSVSKGHTADSIRQMHGLGVREFGENYAQEMFAKAEELSDLEIHWVYIGHLQSNKIQKIVKCSSEIQTVGALKHARYIARYAKEFNKTPFSIYIAVNADDEPQKSGVLKKDAISLAEQIATELPEITVEGIMSVPPVTADSCISKEALELQDLPDVYQELHHLSQKIGNKKLSLGMSGDLAISIAAGSTCVRIGTALFGKRPNY